MFIKEIKNNDTIYVSIPLTKSTEKTRIKKRSEVNQYGLPVSTKKEKFTLECYVEWQIGYDVVIHDEEKLSKSTLKNIRFIGTNGKEKALYELSEYVYYFLSWGIIKSEKLQEIKTILDQIKQENLFENDVTLSIKRSEQTEKELNGIPFYFTKVEYPILIYKHKEFEIIAEIVMKEKQYAIGVQPMLYLCFPISELKTDIPLIGRTATKNEEAIFELNKNNYGILLELLKIFGMLSSNHRKDIISILDLCLNEYDKN